MDYSQIKEQLKQMKKEYGMAENEIETTNEDVLSPDTMSIAGLIDYQRTAVDQISAEVDKILIALIGGDVPSIEKKEKVTGIFNNCVDLADKIITLRDKVTDLSKYIIDNQ